MAILRTVFWYISFWVYMVYITLFYIPIYFVLGILNQKQLRHSFLDWVVRSCGKFIFRSSGSSVTVHGLDNLPEDKNILFLSNHQGEFDIPLLSGFVPGLKGFLAKMELAGVPILSAWGRLTGCVFINRARPRQAARAIAETITKINQGLSMVVFPEGTSSKGPDMLPFKKGFLRIIAKTDAAIVPITINGSYKIMEANNGKIVPAEVDVYIHKPFRFSELSGPDRENLSGLIYQRISAPLKRK